MRSCQKTLAKGHRQKQWSIGDVLAARLAIPMLKGVPLIPSSVSTFTNVQGRQPASTINVSILVIFIAFLSATASAEGRQLNGAPSSMQSTLRERATVA